MKSTKSTRQRGKRGPRPKALPEINMCDVDDIVTEINKMGITVTGIDFVKEIDLNDDSEWDECLLLYRHATGDKHKVIARQREITDADRTEMQSIFDNAMVQAGVDTEARLTRELENLRRRFDRLESSTKQTNDDVQSLSETVEEHAKAIKQSEELFNSPA